jgi:hypothetical protein
LLDLVDAKQYSRHDLLHRISSISMFKAPSSWSMASGRLSIEETVVANFEAREPPYVRAKLASGVPMLMSTVADARCLTSNEWGSRRFETKKKKRSTLRKYKRLLFGTTTTTTKPLSSPQPVS